MMSASFAYEDPLARINAQTNLTMGQKTIEVFKDMGRNMYRSGRGFGKVGGLYAGIECCIESVSIPARNIFPLNPDQYRARNDMVNPVAAGFLAGGILARSSGPRGALAGGLAFAAFSGAIDLFLRRETKE